MEGHTPTVMPGAPGWNEKLASDSEAVVKAERAAAEAGVPSAFAAPGEDVSGDVKALADQSLEFLRQDSFIDRVVDECLPPREGGKGEGEGEDGEEDPLTRGSSPL